jgi:hypothetical protein
MGCCLDKHSEKTSSTAKEEVRVIEVIWFVTKAWEQFGL